MVDDADGRVIAAATSKRGRERMGTEIRGLQSGPAGIILHEADGNFVPVVGYPFFILALLIVSRSRFFANYEPGVPYLVTMGVAALIVTACPVMLRLSAQASRAKARRRLNNMLIVARSLKDEGRSQPNWRLCCIGSMN
jgi:hypothetical protein